LSTFYFTVSGIVVRLRKGVKKSFAANLCVFFESSKYPENYFFYEIVLVFNISINSEGFVIFVVPMQDKHVSHTPNAHLWRIA